MVTFEWKREACQHGVVWRLYHQQKAIGVCLWLSGSHRYTCNAAAPVKGGSILCTYIAFSAAAARKQLERDWCKRSIGLFADDDIEFLQVTA